MITKFERDVAIDRLEGWELVEFLQIDIEDILEAAKEYDWINDENIEDFRDFIGLREDG